MKTSSDPSSMCPCPRALAPKASPELLELDRSIIAMLRPIAGALPVLSFDDSSLVAAGTPVTTALLGPWRAELDKVLAACSASDPAESAFGVWTHVAWRVIAGAPGHDLLVMNVRVALDYLPPDEHAYAPVITASTVARAGSAHYLGVSDKTSSGRIMPATNLVPVAAFVMRQLAAEHRGYFTRPLFS